MSLDDTENTEIELRDLVTQTLEDNGLLSKIRAQLRAGLYMALENDINVSESYSAFNTYLKSKLASPDIRITFCLVREFLEYFELSYTASVFEKETFMGTAYSYENREKLIEDLDIGINANDNVPLLHQILNIARKKINLSHENDDSTELVKCDNDVQAHNTTYDIPASLEQSHSDHTEYSLSDSSIREQVIGVKTVLRENVNISDQGSSLLITNSTDDNVIKENTEKNEVDSNQVIQISEDKHTGKFETDDTYEGTSSIAEDSILSGNKEQSLLIDFDKTLKFPLNTSNSTVITPTKTLLDHTTIDDNLKSSKLSVSPEHSQISDKKNFKHEKSERIEKLKPMSGLSSLSDLPPLPINKNRNTDKLLLPSLYSKDFRDKSSLKEVDTMVEMNFDSFDNYEEDFMSSASLENDRNVHSVTDPNWKSKNVPDLKVDIAKMYTETSKDKILNDSNTKTIDTELCSSRPLNLNKINESNTSYRK